MFKSECPTCRQAVDVKDLRNNRLLDAIVKYYIDKGVNYAGDNPVHKQKIVDNLDDSKTPRLSSSILRKQKPTNTIQLSTNDKTCGLINPLPPSLDAKRIDKSQKTGKVECPVCSLFIATSFIEQHVDECLAGGDASRNKFTESQQTKIFFTGTKSGSHQTEQRKPLPKRAYRLMTEKQLREQLKTHGLPTTGDREAREKRLREFVLRHNAECDNLNPKPLQSIVDDVLRAERTPTNSITRAITVSDKEFAALTSQVNKRAKLAFDANKKLQN